MAAPLAVSSSPPASAARTCTSVDIEIAGRGPNECRGPGSGESLLGFVARENENGGWRMEEISQKGAQYVGMVWYQAKKRLRKSVLLIVRESVCVYV